MSKAKEDELNSAVWLAQRATAILVAVCFIGLPMFWLNFIIQFSDIQTTMMVGHEEMDYLELEYGSNNPSNDPWSIPTQLI